MMPIGDPVGNSPLEEMLEYDEERWESVGQCDEDELYVVKSLHDFDHFAANLQRRELRPQHQISITLNTPNPSTLATST